MRNLKKVLSLSLAFVMLLGMMVIGAGAVTDIADFSDTEEISADYREAVDLLTAIEVLEGTSGAFKPAGTLTREQAAKIIATVALGVDAAQALTTTVAPFSDVAATRWSAGYIAYCANVGIINGVGGNRFNPTGEVTGYQFAKMLLGVVGYGANNEYVGSNWVLNTASDAINTGISDRVNISNTAITREEAAQLAFNAIQVRTVSYSPLYGTYLSKVTDDGVTELLGTIAYNIFKLTTNGYTDDYQYNWHAWCYQNNRREDITDTYLSDNILGTFTTANGTWGALYRAFPWDANVTVVENGTYFNSSTFTLGDGTVTATARTYDNTGTANGWYSQFASAALRNVTDKKAIAYNGQVITGVDTDHNGAVDTLIITTAYLAEVVKVNAETANNARTVSVRAYIPSLNTATSYVTADIETEDYAVGDKILVEPKAALGTIKANVAANTLSTYFVQALTSYEDPCGQYNSFDEFNGTRGLRAAENFTGSVSAFYLNVDTKADGSVTTNNTKYIYNGVFQDSSAVGYMYTVSPGYTLVSATYRFYQDPVGNVIGVEVVQDSIGDYVYVLAVGENQFERSNVVMTLDNEGNIKTYNVSSKSDDHLFDTTARTNTPSDPENHDGLRATAEGVGVIYSYSVDASGEIILKRLNGYYNSVYNIGAMTFSKGFSTLTYSNGTSAYKASCTEGGTSHTHSTNAPKNGVVYANDATVFLWYDAKTGRVARFEGYTNAVNIKDIKGVAALATQAVGSNTYATLVVLTDAYEAQATDWVYILGTRGNWGGATLGGNFNYWDGIMSDGTITTFANTTAQSKVNPANAYYYSVDANGFAGDPANGVTSGLYTTKDDTLTIKTGTVAVKPVNNSIIIRFMEGNVEKQAEYLYAEGAKVFNVEKYATEGIKSVYGNAQLDVGNQVRLIMDGNKSDSKVLAVIVTYVDQAYITEIRYTAGTTTANQITKVETGIKAYNASAWAYRIFTPNQSALDAATLLNSCSLVNASSSLKLYATHDGALNQSGAITTGALTNNNTYYLRVDFNGVYNIFEVVVNPDDGTVVTIEEAKTTMDEVKNPSDKWVKPNTSANVSGATWANAVLGAGKGDAITKDLSDTTAPTYAADVAARKTALNDAITKLGLTAITGTTDADYNHAQAIAAGKMLIAGWTGSATTLEITAKDGTDTVVYTETFSITDAPGSETAHQIWVTLDCKSSLGASASTANASYWNENTSTGTGADAWNDQGLKAGNYTWTVKNSGTTVAQGSFTVSR